MRKLIGTAAAVGFWVLALYVVLFWTFAMLLPTLVIWLLWGGVRLWQLDHRAPAAGTAQRWEVFLSGPLPVLIGPGRSLLRWANAR